jgi:hypothetical protein
MKGERNSKKLINTHLVKTWAMAEGDIGDKEPLWQDGSWLAAMKMAGSIGLP